MIERGKKRITAARPWKEMIGPCMLLVVGCVMATAACADEPRRHVNNFEITPFVGYMGGGRFNDPADGSDRDLKDDTTFGFFADMVADVPERHYELLYASQSSTVKGAVPIDMDVQYLQIGGTVSYTDAGYVVPYFGATIGAARFSPDASGLDDKTKLAFSLGGGMKIPFTDHVGMRLDARAFLSVLDSSDSELFCSSGATGGACALTARSDTFVQYSASLGIVAAF
jgi:opacity protein-like surface antigen